jgi:hypothetical protein
VQTYIPKRLNALYVLFYHAFINTDKHSGATRSFGISIKTEQLAKILALTTFKANRRSRACVCKVRVENKIGVPVGKLQPIQTESAVLLYQAVRRNILYTFKLQDSTMSAGVDNQYV